MISEQDCYVYIFLPGESEPVTAGRLIITETNSRDYIGRFVYGKTYMECKNAVPIDPVTLTLSDKVFETGMMGGLFGAFRDASPDLWGRILIERYMGRTDLSEMDYLLNSPDDRIGALSFGTSKTPPLQAPCFSKSRDLEKLQHAANLIGTPDVSTGSIELQTQELLLIGTSMGGARPKAVVVDDGALWVAKFAHPSDRFDMALTEHAMLKLAEECGICVPPCKTVKIGSGNVLLVKRFDRDVTNERYLRHRMISALTALRTDDNPLSRNKWSYVLIADELRRFSEEPVLDARELFRRMVFNALITNIDDHPRNHAFVAVEGWRLAPAYDLTPFPQISIERRDLAMICGAGGRAATNNNLLSECHRFMYKPDEAAALIADMADMVTKSWHKTAKQSGLSKQDCETIKPAFVYPGFFGN